MRLSDGTDERTGSLKLLHKCLHFFQAAYVCWPATTIPCLDPLPPTSRNSRCEVSQLCWKVIICKASSEAPISRVNTVATCTTAQKLGMCGTRSSYLENLAVLSCGWSIQLRRLKFHSPALHLSTMFHPSHPQPPVHISVIAFGILGYQYLC